jgi:GT2 family glycosyltransferase
MELNPSKESDTSHSSLAIITVCYNDEHRLPQFLAMLPKIKTHTPFFIFVDNASHDHSVELVRSQIPSAEVIQLDENRGTTGGYNVGYRAAFEHGVDYVMNLAIDISLENNCLENLLEACERDPGIGAVGPLLFYSDEPNKVQMYGGSLDVKTGASRHDHEGITDISCLPRLYDAGYLDGGTMLIRASVLRLVGGFDEKLFMYYEDSDLSYRIQQGGCRTVAVRDAQAWHFHRENKGVFPPPYELFYITRNRFYFVHKHTGTPARNSLIWRTLRESPRRLFSYVRRWKFTLTRAYLAGIACGVSEKMGKRGWVE